MVKVKNEICFYLRWNLLLVTQSVDSCLCILIPLNILILHPIFINWSVSLLLHKASFYKTKVTENLHECSWLHTQTWTRGILVLEFLESLPLSFFFRLEPGNTWIKEWKWQVFNVARSFTQILIGLKLEIQRPLHKYFLKKFWWPCLTEEEHLVF